MNKLSNFYLKDKLHLTIFIFIIFIIGICFGAYSIKTVDYGLKQDMYKYFGNFIHDFEELQSEVDYKFWSIFKNNFLSFIIICSSGFLVFTVPLIPFIIFIRGFVIGFSSAFLLNQYGLKGIVSILFIICPQNILFITAYICTSVLCIDFAGKIIKYYRGNKRFLIVDLKHVIVNIFIWSFVILIGVFLKIYLVPILMKFSLKILI